MNLKIKWNKNLNKDLKNVMNHIQKAAHLQMDGNKY